MQHNSKHNKGRTQCLTTATYFKNIAKRANNTLLSSNETAVSEY